MDFLPPGKGSIDILKHGWKLLLGSEQKNTSILPWYTLGFGNDRINHGCLKRVNLAASLFLS